MNSATPYRLVVMFAAQHLNFRVQAHKTDPHQLVVKSTHPEALDAFVVATGMELGAHKTIKGSANFVSFVDKKQFSAMLAKFAELVAEPVPDPVLSLVQDPPEEDGEGDEENNDGNDLQ